MSLGVLTATCLANRELTAQKEPGFSGWCMAGEKKGMGACMETRLLQTGQEENLSEAGQPGSGAERLYSLCPWGSLDPTGPEQLGVSSELALPQAELETS